MSGGRPAEVWDALIALVRAAVPHAKVQADTALPPVLDGQPGGVVQILPDGDRTLLPALGPQTSVPVTEPVAIVCLATRPGTAWALSDAIAPALLADPSLGGRIDGMTLDPPTADHAAIEAAPEITAVTIRIRLDYTASLI